MTTNPKPAPAKTVFLFDVDNTLLDNDRVIEDLREYLDIEVGSERAQCYWRIFDHLRAELGYADYLGALQRCRIQYPHELHLLMVSRFLIDYPFSSRLLPGALEVIALARGGGVAAILSDGDVVFQPHKVARSGLFKAVEGNVMIYVHKEKELDDVKKRYPAEHYILVDDKMRLLTAIKKSLGSQVTTVFVRQGHYALDPQVVSSYPPADLTLERIGDFLNHDLEPFLKPQSLNEVK